MKAIILYSLYALLQSMAFGVNYVYLQSAAVSTDTIMFILMLLGVALHLPLYVFLLRRD